MSSNKSDIADSARRQITRQAVDAFPRMGVYAIRDRETGKVLVGSSRNVDGAINRAQFELRMRSHSNKVLQAAWNSSGAQRFTFEIIDLLKQHADPNFDYPNELRLLEQLYQAEFGNDAGTA